MRARQRGEEWAGPPGQIYHGSPVTRVGTLECPEINHILVTLADAGAVTWKTAMGARCEAGQRDRRDRREPPFPPLPLCPTPEMPGAGWRQVKHRLNPPGQLCHVQFPSSGSGCEARGPRMYIYLSDILKMSPRSER